MEAEFEGMRWRNSGGAPGALVYPVGVVGALDDDGVGAVPGLEAKEVLIGERGKVVSVAVAGGDEGAGWPGEEGAVPGRITRSRFPMGVEVATAFMSAAKALFDSGDGGGRWPSAELDQRSRCGD